MRVRCRYNKGQDVLTIMTSVVLNNRQIDEILSQSIIWEDRLYKVNWLVKYTQDNRRDELHIIAHKLHCNIKLLFAIVDKAVREANDSQIQRAD